MKSSKFLTVCNTLCMAVGGLLRASETCDRKVNGSAGPAGDTVGGDGGDALRPGLGVPGAAGSLGGRASGSGRGGLTSAGAKRIADPAAMSAGAATSCHAARPTASATGTGAVGGEAEGSLDAGRGGGGRGCVWRPVLPAPPSAATAAAAALAAATAASADLGDAAEPAAASASVTVQAR
uniref:Uncharacterized protein n=1 Tax=Alexandrium monilatum TaxID=311494 RepID=A0A7S4VD53_9DINO|mmetsp:Transcript_92247/g.285059  ORF Transcript_92247/g.285059 Transcript_92247/m.285059 type:complete len:180 (+) Transcript_92247:200-739(+)